MLQTLRKAADFLDARQRRVWLLLIPLTVVTAALEAVAAVAVFALIRLVDDSKAADSIALVSVLRPVLGAPGPELVAPFAALVAVFYLVKNGLRLLEVFVRRRCAAASEVAIASSLLRRYLAAPYVFHLRRNSADLIRNTTHAAHTVSSVVLLSATAAASEVMVVVGILGVVVTSTPGVALAAGAAVAAAMVVLLRLTQSRHARWGARNHALQAAIVRTLQQSLGGVKEVLVLGRQAFFAEAFSRRAGEASRLQVLRGTLEIAPRLLVETLFVVGVVSVIALVHRGADARLIPLLGLFAYAGLRILPSLHWIVYYANNLRFGRSSLDEIHRDWVGLGEPSEPAGAGERLPFRDRIALEGVSYAYPGSARETLSGLDLVIRCGESVGVVGATGAGKTTLVDLVLGLLVPTRGRITVDGRDVRDRPAAWQRQIGYVPQSVYLTDDTIRRNVAFGLPEPAIDDDRVWAAARMARIEDWIRSLPAGLDTPVGERGVRVSGGQRQRIAVARALYGDPEVLVFDEATAALDSATEREVTREIESLQREKTVLVVAHRLSTVRHCDRLILLRDGRIADSGPFDTLRSRSPEFRALAAASEV